MRVAGEVDAGSPEEVYCFVRLAFTQLVIILFDILLVGIFWNSWLFIQLKMELAPLWLGYVL